MALIDCRECGKPVSSSATKCPQCGIRTPNIKQYKIVNGLVIFFASLIILPAMVILVLAAGDTGDTGDTLVDERVSAVFVRNMPELGSLVRIEDTANWAEGKRQFVTTSEGTFLFYLKGNEVVTVYMSDENSDFGRREIWRKDDESLAAKPLKNQKPTVIKWDIYQPGLKQGIDQMAEEKNCEVLKKFFDNAFDLQQSDRGHAPLVIYVAEKSSDAGCQK